MVSNLTLTQMQRIRQWHAAHRAARPLECHAWDAALCCWVMGWVGWLPVFLLELFWAAPLCLLGSLTPRLYVGWRVRAHRRGRLRCDWLAVVGRRQRVQ